jgi:hypothetical protein
MQGCHASKGELDASFPESGPRFAHHSDPSEPVPTPSTCFPMATAIARIVTPEGVVIAADGRAVDKFNGTILTDSMQKIFPARNRMLAYSVSGIALLTKGDSDDVLFDFLTATHAAVAMPFLQRQLSMHSYASTLAMLLHDSLSLTRQDAGVSQTTTWPTPQADSQTVICLDGYCESEMAEQRELIFYHNRPPGFAVHVTHNGYWIGSQRVRNVLYDRADPRLAAYKMPFLEPNTVSEAISRATKYIHAYGEPDARSIDPKVCDSVGNRLHIATITPANGFQWVSGFEPSQM